jgi:hypothetical protein
MPNKPLLPSQTVHVEPSLDFRTDDPPEVMKAKTKRLAALLAGNGIASTNHWARQLGLARPNGGLFLEDIDCFLVAECGLHADQLGGLRYGRGGRHPGSKT